MKRYDCIAFYEAWGVESRFHIFANDSMEAWRNAASKLAELDHHGLNHGAVTELRVHERKA